MDERGATNLNTSKWPAGVKGTRSIIIVGMTVSKSFPLRLRVCTSLGFRV